MKSSFREQFEQMAHRRAEPRRPSGSLERVELRWEHSFPNTIDAIKTLRDCGLTLVEAKAAIEKLMVERVLTIDLPGVDSISNLVERMTRTGATVRVMTPATVR